MKTSLFAVLFALALAGCATTPAPNPNPIAPSLVEIAVQASVTYGIAEKPSAIPYLQASKLVICAAAANNVLGPQQVIDALENSEAVALKTPEGVIILNAALSLYGVIYVSYGANVPDSTVQPYLQAVCNGMTLALPSTNKLPIAISVPHLK